MSAAVENWVDRLQEKGQYSFLRGKALAECGITAEGVKKGLQRLAARGRIAKAKDYFYVIVPLEYRAAGIPPAAWFIHDLMEAMDRPYYVGLLSAAALHGASHHQPQVFQVVTDRPIRPIHVGRLRLRFFASRFVTEAAIANVKTPTGSMQISTPETTALDLVRFARQVGGLDQVATVIAELAEKIDPQRMASAARAVGDVPSARRLGYILDKVAPRKLAEPLWRWSEKQSAGVVSLRAHRRGENAQENRRWRIQIDRPLEIEA